MKLVLDIAFDSKVSTDVRIKIENPPYVPSFGEIVNFEAADFLVNVEDVQSMKEYTEYGIWKVGFKSVTYKKDLTEVFIILEEDGVFNANHKNY
jgi:hypothetical protein